MHRIVLIGMALAVVSCAGSTNERTYTDFVPSPDGAWVAAIRHDHWSMGFGGDEMTSSVELQRPGHSKDGITVLSVEDVPAPSNVRLQWAGPKHLTISFDDYGINFQAVKAQGIDITAVGKRR